MCMCVHACVHVCVFSVCVCVCVRERERDCGCHCVCCAALCRCAQNADVSRCSTAPLIQLTSLPSLLPLLSPLFPSFSQHPIISFSTSLPPSQSFSPHIFALSIFTLFHLLSFSFILQFFPYIHGITEPPLFLLLSAFPSQFFSHFL